MVPAVRPLGPLSMARGCARIDSRPDTAKIGSADRVEVHHARLLAVIGVRKTFPHGLGLIRTSRERPSSATAAMSEKCHEETFAEQRARSASIVAMPVRWPGAIGCSD